MMEHLIFWIFLSSAAIFHFSSAIPNMTYPPWATKAPVQISLVLINQTHHNITGNSTEFNPASNKGFDNSTKNSNDHSVNSTTDNSTTVGPTRLWNITKASSTPSVIIPNLPALQTPPQSNTNSVVTTQSNTTAIHGDLRPNTWGPDRLPSRTPHSPIASNMSMPADATGGLALSHSEKALTVFLSVVLGIFVLGLVMYVYSKLKQRRAQYSHHPLYNSEDTANDTGGQIVATDDTLFISGGLYDGSQIYNPTTSVWPADDTAQSAFALQLPEFRLEFLQEDQESPSNNEIPDFQSFQ